MALQRYIPNGDAPSVKSKPLSFSIKVHANARHEDPEISRTVEPNVDIDLREVYFLMMHFLSTGPCHGTYGQFRKELLEHQLLPRRYHAWYSRNGTCTGDENDDGLSYPLSYDKLVERYPHVESDHLVKLLKQLIQKTASPSHCMGGRNAPNAADVPTLLGAGSFSLLSDNRNKGKSEIRRPPVHMRWPHMQADQVRGLTLREIGGGFSRHHRAPSIRAACYAIAKPSTMVQKMENTKRLRGHRNAVYCAIFDRSGRYVITGSDDRLVKIWSMETAYCLASCRGHEGDITDLAVSSNNALVASASNDSVIRVWCLPDGRPISVLRGHTGAVTAIAFSPKPNSVYHLLSSSDDGTCRIWDARTSTINPRIYVPRPSDSIAGKNNGPSSSSTPQNHQIFCCAFNVNGTVFVTGSSDTLARVWVAGKPGSDDSEQPNHEMDVLSGHENDVNYVQFSGCAVTSRYSQADASKEDNFPKFKNSWFTHDNIVTCSRDGSAIIWVPRSRRSHGKIGRWTRAYHLKVPPPPMLPQPPRGGPRQRILPTPRGVNMIVWSLDNRFVLAAIMDCRICVWNAADGSLVHSLTGHTASTYVLDVHPFNPRMAMSAGYDGKIIVWDIWEGTPIRVYEISRFKLVDGKFSSDGTSIILSDDVGQLYILNTGQGESQKDAKYDQFFLGDYRPLLQDTHGNVVDQETQLHAYIRNMQDLLCDSAMIPYDEPYQSMYQQRRLGALGKEWHPSSLSLSVGPDITLDQDYQMLPLADLDMAIEPLPEILEVMDWEHEHEIHSDENDSEYNVAVELSSGGERASLSSISSGDAESSANDSEVEGRHRECVRRSRRKKLKEDVEVMTSSGRRVKKRNLDECDGNLIRNSQSRKSRRGKKGSRRKSSSKSLRPQRAAARNALTLFSKISGTSTEGEDLEGSDGDDLSGSESTLQDSNIDSDESGHNGQSKHLRGKEVSLDDSDDVLPPHELPESHNRRKLVLKLPIRNSNKLVPTESMIHELDLVGSSSKIREEVNQHDMVVSQDPGCSSVEANYLDLSECYTNGKIKWGGVKARSSKRMRLGEGTSTDTYARSSSFLQSCDLNKKNAEYLKREEDDTKFTLKVDSQNYEDKMDEVPRENGEHPRDDTAKVVHDVGDGKADSTQYECVENDKSAKLIERATDDTEHHPLDLKESLMPISTKCKSRSERTLKDSEVNTKDSESPSEMDCNPVSEVLDCDPLNATSSDHVDGGVQDLGARVSSMNVSQSLPSHSSKMLKVYQRSKSCKARTNSVGDDVTRNASNHNPPVVVDACEDTADVAHRTRSMGLKVTMRDPDTLDSKLKLKQVGGSEDTPQAPENNNMSRCKLPLEEWGSSSRTTVGLRSTRNRRQSIHIRDTSPVDKRSSHQSARKTSWLMLTEHEEGSRYIPQQGDDVVYLRQGHQEYIQHSKSREPGPWASIKKSIRAVEFCKVVDLLYSTHPGSGDSCCKMTLEFVDPSSEVFEKSFKLTLPEVTGFPDFLVERTRFDAAIKRNWSLRDHCSVWWKNDGEEDGCWWEGRIQKVQAKSDDFKESPWERYAVRYKSKPPETHLHSPWELYDSGTKWEQPHIDDDHKNTLLLAFDELEQSANSSKDYYGVQKLRQVSQKTNYTNRFPVPLSLEVIQSRLENNYYRNLEALKHDIRTMLSNAESYFGKNAEVSRKIKRLSDFWTQTSSSL